MTTPRHEKFLADLAELKLHRIAEIHQEGQDERTEHTRGHGADFILR